MPLRVGTSIPLQWRKLGGDTYRPEVAGSSLSTLTFQCPVNTPERPLGSYSPTPGPDPQPSATILQTGHRIR
jgi:hypothetical protein